MVTLFIQASSCFLAQSKEGLRAGGEKSSHFKAEATGSPGPNSLSGKPEHTVSRAGWREVHSKEDRGSWAERPTRPGGRETLEEGFEGFSLL